jgi:transposase
MLNNVNSPEERRLVILSGIGQDLTSLEIATKMGVKISTVKNDLRAMKYNRDSDLKKAYTDMKKRALKIRQKPAKVRNERFKLMTGMTFQEKNFENMVNYYRPELIKILRSKDENAAIMGLPKSVQRTLTRNDITDGLTNRRQISSKARNYLPLASD